MRSTMKRAAGIAASGVLAAMFVGEGTVDASGAGGPMRDGNWTGTLAVGATIDFSQEGFGLVASGEGNGRFNLTLAGGVGAGDYVLEAASSATLESADSSGQADAIGAITGEMQGTSTGPVLAPLTGHFDIVGEVTVNGLTVPINLPLDFAPEEMLSSTMLIASSSCTVAAGTWAQEFRAAIEAAGANVTNFQGSWAATYAGDTPGATDDALAEMLAVGEAILAQWVDTGTFDTVGLEQLLIDAEHFAASGPTNDGCGSASPGAWASPLAGLVQRLLTAAANSPSTTAEILRFGIAAGLRTNTLPSIAPDTLEASLMTKASELLAAAIAANDTAGMLFVGLSADSMGWTDISAAAAEAMGS
jgi:hypothetical protein